VSHSCADADWVAHAMRVIPGGSLTRSKKVFRRFASRAEGAIVYDTDDRAYIDCLCAMGAISLGYRPPPQQGGVFSFPHHLEVGAAEAVLQDVAPWASWVRFTKTGSEATHAAYRIAKAATGRDTVLRLKGSYHGWHAWCSESDGTLLVDIDPDTVIDDVGLYWSEREPAAVIVEPPRFQSMSVNWLQRIRALCDQAGALLVFDSMIWGGRHALGGASAYYGVIPDLECFGKALGNGSAISFVVGTERTREHGEIPSGTFSGEVSGLAAVVSTLQAYRAEPVVDTIWARGRQLQDGLRAIIPSSLGVVDGHPPCQRVQFVNPVHAQQFSDAMLERGVIWHPQVVLTMAAHTPAHIDHVLAAAAESVGVLA